MEQPDEKIHPGIFIKNNVIPTGITITAAAKLIGVGRPALSNLLNGNASLSPEMAVRLEKAFGVDQNELLTVQTAFDQQENKKHSTKLEVRNYVPAFHSIKSAEIENWVGDKLLEARSLLAVLLRKLTHSTASGLTEIDFPGYDNAERKGWDGKTITTGATPWVPEGSTCWEFGCSKEPWVKAEKDYAARLKSDLKAERLQTTFVFVTPKHWPGKKQWQQTKNAEGNWRSVKVYDANDLEQWLEQSLPVQSWLAQKIGSPENGAQPLETHWENWAGVTDPELEPAIFDAFVVQYKKQLLDFLIKNPAEPLVIAADSKEEALAFIYAAFKDPSFSTEKYLDNTIVFSSAETFKKISKASASFISVVFSEEVEREIGNRFKNRHTIIVRPKNDIQSRQDIVIGDLGYEAFEKVLLKLGIKQNMVSLLAAESGRSLTVLRRRLSKIPAVKNPKWSQDAVTVRDLIPLLFAGVWNMESPADIEVLSLLSGWTKEELEKKVAALLQLEDCPLWSIQKTRGIISKIDILFAVYPHLTETDIEKFLSVAIIVLSEKDPSLDLPEDRRWTASLFGKTRHHSAILRSSLCETVVILAVHGNALIKVRTGVDMELRINKLIASLLTPFNYETIASQNNQLPYYAEAAPDVFLKIIREDLQNEEPQVFSVMTPTNTIFSTSSRTGILWALECLAWDPQRLVDVCEILAKMTVKKINDNLVHKPHASLEAIFRSWMPQTAASLEERKKAIDFLARKYPAVAWQLCIRQLNHSDVAHPSRKPVWRKEYFDFGHATTQKEHSEFMRKVVDLMINWQNHTEQTLADLIQRFRMLAFDVQERLLEIIAAWAVLANDEAKLALRETIRKSILMRKRRKDIDEKIRQQVKKIYDALNSTNVVMKHSWLFITPWVDLAQDEIDDAVMDTEERQRKIGLLRSHALTEIFDAKGTEGIIQLLSSGESGPQIGWLLSQGIIPGEQFENFLSKLLHWPEANLARKIDDLMRGFLAGASVQQTKWLYDTIASIGNDEHTLRLLKMSPLGTQTWQYINENLSHLTTQYWKEVRSEPGNYELSEINELIDRFIDADRPDAAFFATRFTLEKIETERLVRLLNEMANNKDSRDYQFHSYNLTNAFTILNARPDIKEEELASLEFKYVNALDEEYALPNLQKQISKSPSLYLQVLAIVYKRMDKKIDEAELEFINQNKSVALGTSCYMILSQLNRIPGTNDEGKIIAHELLRWIDEVRKLCAKHDRKQIGDQSIGQLLSRAPIGEDGIWPCEPVREVLEERLNDDIAAGLEMGVYNGQGVIFRGVGGREEHSQALRYEQWSNQVSFDYPSVARALQGIAKSYYREASQEQSDESLRTRLGK